jgi:hypothetical protein
MSRIRLLGVTLAVALLAGVLASAAPARPGVGEYTLSTTHFVVHYYSDIDLTGAIKPDWSSETQAGDVAAYAEQAYSLLTGWGYPKPVNDGDGKTDIYLEDFTNFAGVDAFDNIDGISAPTSGWIEMATPTQQQVFADSDGLSLAQQEQMELTFGLLNLSMFGTWLPDASTGDDWLPFGAAQWAGFASIGFPVGTEASALSSPDIALDCSSTVALTQKCDEDAYVDDGSARWAFFQLLATKYGNSFLKNVFANGALGQGAATALSNAIVAKGSTLASVFDEYAEKLMDGDFSTAATTSFRPPVQLNVPGGIKTATLPPVTVPVDHLSARYLTFTRGDGDSSHACFAATLAINVAMPAGTSSQPYFFWDVPGNSPQALSVSGNTASITVPWDTCFWGATTGWLSLPNASTTVDGANFTVTSSVTVDQNTPATAAPPPPAATVWGTTVPVPTTDVAPSIDVFGPELLQVSSTSPAIRLIVESNGPGTLNAALGTTVLGTGQLRAGNNDLRWTLPKGLLTSLRSSASATNLLTLTPMSPSGAASGSPVMLHVVITAPAKAKKAKKPKPKKHPKK